MRGKPIKLVPFVIKSDETDSNSMDMRGTFYRGFTIFGPVTATGTITVQVSHDDVNWCELQSAGSDIDIGDNEAVTVDYSGYPYLRLKSSSAEAGEILFPVYAIEDIT